MASMPLASCYGFSGTRLGAWDSDIEIDQVPSFIKLEGYQQPRASLAKLLLRHRPRALNLIAKWLSAPQRHFVCNWSDLDAMRR